MIQHKVRKFSVFYNFTNAEGNGFGRVFIDTSDLISHATIENWERILREKYNFFGVVILNYQELEA